MDIDVLKEYVLESEADAFYDELVRAMDEFNIVTPRREAAFLANVIHESQGFRRLEENLNYSADGLCKTWPSRFPTLTDAAPYNRQPQKIANKVYANRMGNGSELSGDGWRFRGAGLMQITFRDNYQALANYFGMYIDGVPQWIRTPEGACRSAGWFWDLNNISHYADEDDFDGVCDMINRGHKTTAIGDAIGFAHRLNLYNMLKKDLGE
jgi:putative chitinase